MTRGSGPGVAWSFGILVVLLAAAGVASAQEDISIETGADLFLPVLPADMTFVTGCGGGAFEIGDDWFQFLESDEVAGGSGSLTLPGQPAGYFDTGCGTASFTVDVPSGLDHLHVRFWADRFVQEASLADDAPAAPNAPGINFIQEVRIMDAEGRTLFTAPFFDTEEEGHEETFHDVPPFILPGGTDRITVALYFEDRGYAFSQNFPNFASGEAYASTVRGLAIEFSAVPVPVQVEQRTVRSGNLVIGETHVKVRLDPEMLANYGVNLRVGIGGAMELDSVLLPNGTKLTDTATRTGPGPHGFDPLLVLVERFSGIEQVTVPQGITAGAGAGEYHFVFQTVDPLVISPPLAGLAAILLALPLPFAVMAVLAVRRYEREAFGDYRRSARNLLVALLVMLAFYLSVVASALFGGRIDEMASLPLSFQGWLLYIQIAIAGAAFIVLWRSAHNLDRMTRPRAAVKIVDADVAD